MWKFKKIVGTIATFIVTMLLICLGISVISFMKGDILVNEILSKTGLYFLYTIGYGALDGDAILQNILAMLGIVSLALMSTFLTINLFWRMDDVKVSKTIFFKENSLEFHFINEGRTLCDLKVTFLLYDKNKNKSILNPQEYYMPILLKKSSWNLELSLDETFWYKAVQILLTTNYHELYCMYSFVDTKSGQSSIKFMNFTKENFFRNGKLYTLNDFYHPIVLKKSSLKSVGYGGEIWMEKDGSNYEFDKTKRKDSFVMLYYDFLENRFNLEKYDKERTCLEFTIESNDLHLTLELKLENGALYRQCFEINGKVLCQIYLKDVDIHLGNVREICFTVFKKENAMKGKFTISDFKIETKM